MVGEPGPDVISFAPGSPALDCFPLAAMRQLTAEILERDAEAALRHYKARKLSVATPYASLSAYRSAAPFVLAIVALLVLSRHRVVTVSRAG